LNCGLWRSERRNKHCGFTWQLSEAHGQVDAFAQQWSPQNDNATDA
jgi:hypothetical protein